MDLTPGVTVNALVELPPGFTPIAGEPPLWLQGAKEIALAGKVRGRTEVLGFSGGNYKKMRLVAADGGPGAPHGKIVGLAASPDGQTLAVAEAEPGRIEIVLRYVISNGGQNSVASFDGNFHAVSLNWLAPNTLAVGLAGDPAASPTEAGGLYLIHVLGAVTVEQVKLTCPASMLVFSPDARFAVGEGDEHTPPALFDSRNGKCRHIGLDGPIRVLGWAPGSTALLYSAPAGRDHGAGVFRYTIANGENELIAVSSSAAAYTGAGVVMALGNRDLNSQSAASSPDKRVTAQIASFIPKQNQTLVDTLGMPTTPAMMMASTMTYSHGFAELALQLYVAGPAGPTRKIVTFSIIDRKAFVLASGPFRGVAVIGWSPGANHLVIFDGDGTSGALAVITPQR
ncbi:MAG TPA: hypothetical protein VFX38_07450 [Gammaproteobacteria bacterium]|nr:hypothetical protein [Gammaproteobacteria bacterium]